MARRKLVWLLLAGTVGAYGAGPLTGASAAQFNPADLPDFSEAGYGRVGQPIPSVRTAVTVPGGGAAEIQRALDQVARMPLDAHGVRGAVQLAAVEFRIDRPIILHASGIVLRGSVAGQRRTTLVGTQTMPVMVTVDGSGKRTREGPTIAIVKPVAIGAKRLSLANTAGLHVGDWIIVERLFTPEWIASIGMDEIPDRSDGAPVKQWQAGSSIQFERRIVALTGDGVVLDAAIPDRFTGIDQGRVWRFSFDGRIDNVGVEQIALRGAAIADPARPNAPPPPRDIGLQIGRATNVWVRDLAIDEFATFIDVGRDASDVTVDRVAGGVAGPSRGAAVPTIYSITGQRVLIQNCRFKGDRAHVWSTQSRAAGPNVFRDCVARGNALDAGPHQRWASGTLYDNVDLSGTITVQNRLNKGSGHGWPGATQVFWNDVAEDVRLEQAPGSMNWAIGTSGRQVPIKFNSGTIVSPGRPVSPRSLFDAQLRSALTR